MTARARRLGAAQLTALYLATLVASTALVLAGELGADAALALWAGVLIPGPHRERGE